MGKRRIGGVRRASVGLAVVLSLLGARTAAWAQLGTDVTARNQPAATLLLPNFQVDLSRADGVTTIFSINNASATAILANVVLWSNLAVPVLNFYVYLTGYDAQEINLRQVIGDGLLPQTASAGQDPTDTTSPKGVFSQDINFSTCAGVLPPPALAPGPRQAVQAALTGGFSPNLGGCCGYPFGDFVARGYVTVDTVNGCSGTLPSNPNYFTTDITFQNVLYGDYFQITPGFGLAQSSTLVHILAQPGTGVSGSTPTDPSTTTPGRYTFYGRYTNFSAADHRVPLPTTFAARFRSGTTGIFAGTVLEVWRDPKVNQARFACGTLPSWVPLGQEGITIFDDQEHPLVPPPCSAPPCETLPTLTPFPIATQRVLVGGPALPETFLNGWLYLNLNTFVAAAGAHPGFDPSVAQAWVTVVNNGSAGVGLYSTGYPAVALDSAIAPNHFTP